MPVPRECSIHTALPVTSLKMPDPQGHVPAPQPEPLSCRIHSPIFLLVFFQDTVCSLTTPQGRNSSETRCLQASGHCCLLFSDNRPFQGQWHLYRIFGVGNELILKFDECGGGKCRGWHGGPAGQASACNARIPHPSSSWSPICSCLMIQFLANMPEKQRVMARGAGSVAPIWETCLLVWDVGVMSGGFNQHYHNTSFALPIFPLPTAWPIILDL